MRRPILLFIVLLAALCGWAGSPMLDHPTLAPEPMKVPGIDGPATSRWALHPPAAPPATAAIPHDWLAEAERGIAAREYEATPNGEGLQAPNRAHGFRTYFEPTGVRLVERTATSAPLAAMRLERAGREDASSAVAPGTVSAHGARVEIRRGGGLVEWYENSPRGLEQGFTLAARPAGTGRVVLELAVENAHVECTGTTANLEAPNGRRLAYSGLAAVDARGRALAAHLATCDGDLRLAVDDTGAEYPITIDPLIGSNADTQLQINQAGARFGISVAGVGDVNGDGFEDVLVGADQMDSGETDEGVCYLFLGRAIGPNGLPSATFQSNESSCFMGYVAAAGDVNGDGYADILCGGYGHSASHGIVCLFLGGPSGIASGSPATASATFTSTLNQGSFGLYSSSAGDVNGDGYDDVIIGDKDYNGTGAAWLWLGSATGITSGNSSTAATQLIGTQASARFGASVAGIGDVNGDGFDDIAVGAPQYDDGENNEGAVFLWYGSATGIPSGSQNGAFRTIESNQIGGQLGQSVAGAGDVNGDGYPDLVAAAFSYTNGAETGEGSAFVFNGGPSGITVNTVAGASAQVQMNQNNAGVNFVASAGDVNGDGFADVVIGSPGFDDGALNTGAAIVELGSATGLVTGASGGPVDAYATLHLPAVQANAAFGQRVSAADVNGDGYSDVIVGVAAWDGVFADQGEAFIYDGNSRSFVYGSTASANATLVGNQSGMPEYGYSVASAGDVNGDGFSDVIIGAPRYDAGQVDEGAAFVFHGSTTGIASGAPGSAAAMLQSDQVNAQFGFSVGAAGDVNGDGDADVIVGAPYDDLGGTTNGGAAFLFLGSTSGVASGNPASAASSLRSDLSDAQFGRSVAGAGDVNGDGYADVVVGAPFYDADIFNHGAAWIYHGSAAGIASGDPSVAATAFHTNANSTEFGISVASAGDVNGDGFSDVIIGAPFATVTASNEGAAYLYHGRAGGIPSGGPETADATLRSNTVNGDLGSSVAGAGDVNGDGFGDVIVGAEFFNSNNGAAWVFLGGASGVPSGTIATANFTLNGTAANNYLGRSVAGVGDADGDGYADIAIGAPGHQGVGTVFTYRGSAAGISGSGPTQLTSTQSGSQHGQAVAGAGDVNGDGFADIVTGATTMNGAFGGEGAAFLFHGGYRALGRHVSPQQLRGDGSGLEVQPWGLAHATDRFRAAMFASDPAGRRREKMEVETCPFGVPFGSGSCTHTVSSTWTDAGATGSVVLATDVTASPGIHRWRVRALHAPRSVTLPGIGAPPKPAHGPWRRFQSQAVEADLRVDAVVLAVERPFGASGLAIAPVANPARGRIVLAATLPNGDAATVELFDVVGRRVAMERIVAASGSQTVAVGRGEIPASGVYLVRLTQGGRAVSTRVVFVR